MSSMGLAAMWLALGILFAAALAVNMRYSRRLRTAESPAALYALRRTLLPEDGWFVGALVLGTFGMAAWTVTGTRLDYRGSAPAYLSDQSPDPEGARALGPLGVPGQGWSAP